MEAEEKSGGDAEAKGGLQFAIGLELSDQQLKAGGGDARAALEGSKKKPSINLCHGLLFCSASN